MRLLASEFPCDNPDLHAGTTWVCDHPTAAPHAEAPAAEPQAPRESGITLAASPDASAPPPPPLHPYGTLVAAIGAVAREAGASTTDAELIRLLEGEEVAGTRLPADAPAIAAAWRSLLCDEGSDFSVCGSRMLDEWAAEVAAQLAGARGRTEALRRELRRRGVAAFGLLADAA